MNGVQIALVIVGGLLIAFSGSIAGMVIGGALLLLAPALGASK